MKRRLITGAALTALLWSVAAWWATTMPDPITAKGFALLATIGLWTLIGFFSLPSGNGEVTWIEPPEIHSPTQEELDARHQHHLNEQARYLYLAGEHTPPTDWHR